MLEFIPSRNKLFEELSLRQSGLILLISVFYKETWGTELHYRPRASRGQLCSGLARFGEERSGTGFEKREQGRLLSFCLLLPPYLEVCLVEG